MNRRTPSAYDLTPENERYLLCLTPEKITSLLPNEVFVFGSNLRGVHGAGAARDAVNMFGAEWGTGFGITGQCFAIPTKDEKIKTMPLENIRPYVNDFIAYAVTHEDLTFLVTPIGCGLAGYTPEDIAPLFKNAVDVENIHLPLSFWAVLIK